MAENPGMGASLMKRLGMIFEPSGKGQLLYRPDRVENHAGGPRGRCWDVSVTGICRNRPHSRLTGFWSASRGPCARAGL